MESGLQESMLLGIGNPLLDIAATVENTLLEKYGLVPNGAIMAEEKHMPLYKELQDNYSVEYMAGGSVQNSMRVVQWILKKPKVCTYMGCVGDDKDAKILEQKASDEGVNVLYQVTTEAPTGTCAVLITGTSRSLVANLAAAQKFTPDHLDTPQCKDAIAKAKFFYISGFFLVVSLEATLRLAKHAHENRLLTVFNLSAEFVSQFFKKSLDEIVPYADVLIGNEVEWDAFAKAFDFKTEDKTELGLKAAALPRVSNRERVVIITQGPNPVLIIEGTKVTSIDVMKLEREQIVDTNGAGDAFAGGFLSQLVLGKPYDTCVKCGNYAARHVIQNSGCHFSGPSDFS